MGAKWIRAVGLDELRERGAMVFRHSGKQLALFYSAEGIHACNNRCPHEGYPLSEGTLDGSCTLTCNWHNWKFNLTSGENVYGGDRLRVYPTEIRGKDVWVDCTEPPIESRRAEIAEHLEAAFDDHEYERLAREIARWKLLGGDPLELVARAIAWSYERLEFGWTHAYAGAADWLTLYDEHAGDEEAQLICILEVIGHVAEDVLREARYPYAEGSERFSEDAFLDAIEQEDEARAVRLMRGATTARVAWSSIEGALTRAALLHYNDFGHSLIYVSKLRALAERFGREAKWALLVSLVRGMVFARREDKIPEFRAYRSSLDGWRSCRGETRPRAEDFFGLGINKCLQRVRDFDGVPVESLYDALLGANALNMVKFDLSYQDHTTRSISDNVGWLDFTHAITFANAVREQCSRYPDCWPAGLLQLACFSGRNAAFVDETIDAEAWSVGDTAQAIDGFFATTMDGLLDHGREEYIVSVHILKTLLAARAEARACPRPGSGPRVAAAVNRFLNEPLKRKHVRRTVHQALSFVAHDL